MLKFLKRLYAPIAAGNAYRREVRGDPKENAERDLALQKAHRESCRAKTMPMIVSSALLDSIEKEKAHYGYWDNWTGGRFERVENPYLNLEPHKARPGIAKEIVTLIKQKRIVVDYLSIIRVDPVTGNWKGL